MIKAFLFGCIFFMAGVLQSENQVQNEELKAWIEIEGKVSNLTVHAKFLNKGKKTITVDYVLKTWKKGRSGNSSTLQKGKCISPANKTLLLSESRMHLSEKDNLHISLIVYRNKLLVAQDSVVFHIDNE